MILALRNDLPDTQSRILFIIVFCRRKSNVFPKIRPENCYGQPFYGKQKKKCPGSFEPGHWNLTE
jgi:hypothetical protein